MKVLACQNPTSTSLPTCLEQMDSWSSGLILFDRSVASDRLTHSLLLETSSSLGSLGSLAVSPCFSPYSLTRLPQCPLQAPIPLPLDLSVSGLGHGHSSFLLQDPPHLPQSVPTPVTSKSLFILICHIYISSWDLPQHADHPTGPLPLGQHPNCTVSTAKLLGSPTHLPLGIFFPMSSPAQK